MSDSKPVTPAELCSRAGTTERYIREWLANQAAGGYITASRFSYFKHFRRATQTAFNIIY